MVSDLHTHDWRESNYELDLKLDATTLIISYQGRRAVVDVFIKSTEPRRPQNKIKMYINLIIRKFVYAVRI